MKKDKKYSEVEELNIEIWKKECSINERKEQIAQIIDDISYDFKANRLMEEEGYTQDDAILQYHILLDMINKFITNKSERDMLLSYEEQIQNQLKILESGKKGEELTFQAMELLGSKIRYLTNIRFNYQNIDVEIDLIVIAPTGIFAIEIKNWKHNAILTDKGILESEVDKSKKTDIIAQIRRHSSCLYRILVENEENKEVYNKDLKINSIILWQNIESKITDNFKRVPICCVNELEYEISDNDKYKYSFSDKQIEEIYDFLCSKKQKERRYPLGVGKDFIDKLIECATFERNMELQKEIRELELLNNRKAQREHKEYMKKNKPVKYYGGKVVKGAGTVGKTVVKAAIVTAIVVTSLGDD